MKLNHNQNIVLKKRLYSIYFFITKIQKKKLITNYSLEFIKKTMETPILLKEYNQLYKLNYPCGFGENNKLYSKILEKIKIEQFFTYDKIQRGKNENRVIFNLYREKLFYKYEKKAYDLYSKYVCFPLYLPIKYKFKPTHTMKIKAFLWTSPRMYRRSKPLIDLRSFIERAKTQMMNEYKTNSGKGYFYRKKVGKNNPSFYITSNSIIYNNLKQKKQK